MTPPSTEHKQPGVTNQHYDLPPRVFELFLDEALKYSSGLYLKEDDTLDQAQIQKMDFIASQLRVRRGERVLDIGCGWGSLTLFLAEKVGCDVVGITPSPRQAEFIRERARVRGLDGAVRIECSHFEDLELPARSFDAITLVGSIVHMVDKARVLDACYRAARHRGRLYLSETCFRNQKRYDQFRMGQVHGFVRDEIFGWGDIVPISKYIVHLEDAGFSLCGLTDLTSHYSRTIAEWRSRAERHRAEIDELAPNLTNQLIRYFDISNAAWGFTTKQYAVTAEKQR
jgi:cyclopropane-fatty-acyl-phospholipid synthase